MQTEGNASLRVLSYFPRKSTFSDDRATNLGARTRRQVPVPAGQV